jgi:hypothetical protein
VKFTYDTEEEEWRPVVGHPSYEVSSLGAVRSVDRTLLCGDGRTRRFKGRPVKGAYDKRMGYHRVMLYDHAKATGFTVHSLVTEAFIGPPPPGEEVRHKNGDPKDNRLSNLEYGTRSQNMQDAVRHGTHGQLAKTCCPRGHDLMYPNLVRATAEDGRRDCLACARTRAHIRVINPRFQEVSDRKFRSIMEG